MSPAKTAPSNEGAEAGRSIRHATTFVMVDELVGPDAARQPALVTAHRSRAGHLCLRGSGS